MSLKKSALVCGIICIYGIGVVAQSKIEWTADKKLSQSDFQALAPNNGTQQTIYSSMIVEYGIQNYQLLFSNLNETVSCSFLPPSSWLDEGDQSEQLLKYAQIQWNMQELMARQLRKSFIENRKTLGQKKMNLLYEQVSRESAELQSRFAKETDFGRKEDQLLVWQATIDNLLLEYSDYCKTCKPPKKRKRKAKS